MYMIWRVPNTPEIVARVHRKKGFVHALILLTRKTKRIAKVNGRTNIVYMDQILVYKKLPKT